MVRIGKVTIGIFSPGASDDQMDKILHKHQVEVARLAEAQEDEKKQQEEHFKVRFYRISNTLYVLRDGQSSN